MNNITNTLALTASLLFAVAHAAFATPVTSANVVNYASPVSANAFFRWSDTLWVATSGGLRIHDLSTDSAEFVSNSRIFPDLHLTAITRDDRGNLWIGSRAGYLYRRTPRGQFTVYSNYRLSGWGINALFCHGGLIVVGSNRGVSLFDPVSGVALRNAAGIANFSNPRVNAITSSLRGDTLFLGCEEGVAYIDSLDIVPLSRRNFYYSGIWKTKRVGRVTSFVQTADSVRALATPSTMVGELLFTVVGDGRRVAVFDDRGRPVENEYGVQAGITLPASGGVSALYNESGQRLWIGTADAFYYSNVFGDTALVQHRIDGFTLKRAVRVTVDERTGNVWVLPGLPTINQMWHHGVYMYDGVNWRMYNNTTHPEQFGFVGEGDALGIAPVPDGSVWVGTYGGNIKHIRPHDNTVAQLTVTYNSANFSYVENGVGLLDWGRSDALAIDTSGYLWISVFDNPRGSLVCYDQRHRPDPALETVDPVRARYRRFFTEAPFLTRNITLLRVDSSNRIFAYDTPQNRLTVFRHGGNPLADGIVIDTVFANIGLVSAIETGSDGTVYIAVAGVLKKLDPGTLRLTDVGVEAANISSIAMWENVMWLGTLTGGIVRYDLVSGESVRIDEASGLPSNSVLSVAIDKGGRRLWAVTGEGVSRIDVGRAVSVAPRAGLRAFPNVFSISGSGNQSAAGITFAGLEAQSVVSIYTVSGTLVAKIDADRFTDHEWRAVWTPRRGLTPGTYLAAVGPSGRQTRIILRP